MASSGRATTCTLSEVIAGWIPATIMRGRTIASTWSMTKSGFLGRCASAERRALVANIDV
jgi:hypothetical protein